MGSAIAFFTSIWPIMYALAIWYASTRSWSRIPFSSPRPILRSTSAFAASSSATWLRLGSGLGFGLGLGFGSGLGLG